MDELEKLVEMAIAEDIGPGDVTSNTTISEEKRIKFVLNSRDDIVVCGMDAMEAVFRRLNVPVKFEYEKKDGDLAKEGDILLHGEGPARGILTGERIALNLLQYLSGVATNTRTYVDLVEGTGAKILDTRKTLPGYRKLAKYAVKTGGGENHRFGLYDMVMIKDNHIAAAGSISQAVAAARKSLPRDMKIEVECDTLPQVQEALTVNVEWIMLDNMDCPTMRRAVDMVKGRAKLEASGNVSLETVRGIAETGVDYISIGRLTHSVRAADIGLDILDG